MKASNKGLSFFQKRLMKVEIRLLYKNHSLQSDILKRLSNLCNVVL